MDLGTVIIWLVIGFVAGAVAGYIVPGRTPGGIVGTTVIGIIGGFVGGWLLDALDVSAGYSWLGSLVVAILGAVIVLYVLRLLNRGT